MNYIEQINAFWLAHEEHEFTPIEICLYFYLLKVCNMLRWKSPFNRNSSKILSDLGISRSASENSRIRLKKCGIIDFKSVNGSANIEFTLLDISKKYAIPNTDYNTGENAGRNAGRQTGNSTGGPTSTEGSNTTGKEVLNINKTETKIKENIYRAFAHLELFEDEFYKLVDLGYPKEDIDKILDAIENYKGNKKYNSLFNTAKSWLEKNKEKSSAKKESQVDGAQVNYGKIEKQRNIDTVLNAFEVYKTRQHYTDHDNIVYKFLITKDLLKFEANDNRVAIILQLEKDGDLQGAKQMALMAYFHDLAEAGRELKDLLNTKTN
jgi:hypothetical protein